MRWLTIVELPELQPSEMVRGARLPLQLVLREHTISAKNETGPFHTNQLWSFASPADRE